MSFNEAWVFATAGRNHEQLFTALAAAAMQRMKDCTAQIFANTAWAFATVARMDKQLFGALAAVAEWRMRDCNDQDIANIAWALTESSAFVHEIFRN